MKNDNHPLKAWLAQHKTSQREFSEKLNIHYMYLNKILMGHQWPGARLAFKIQQETGIPAQELIYWQRT